MSTTNIDSVKNEEEQTYVCNECGTHGWGDERGEINEDGDFTCEECIEKAEEDYEVICECCKHGLTREELDERTEKGFNSVCFDCEPKEPKTMTKQEELREIIRLMQLEREAFLQEQTKNA